MKYAELKQNVSELTSSDFVKVQSLDVINDTYINTKNTVYEVEDIVVTPSTINFFPETVKLTFKGITTIYDRNGAIESQTTENVSENIVINDNSDLNSYIFWNGIRVPYEVNIEVGVASILYTKKIGTTESGEEKFDYQVVSINKKTSQIMDERGWSPIGVLVATAEQCGEEANGDDRFMALIENIESKYYNYKSLTFNAPVKQFAFGHNNAVFSTSTETYSSTVPNASTSGITDFDGKNHTARYVALHSTIKNLRSDQKLDNLTSLQDVAPSYRYFTSFTKDVTTSSDAIYLTTSTDSTTKNNCATSGCPAAMATYAYSTVGTKKGDWYLPAMGELWVALGANSKSLILAQQALYYDSTLIYSNNSSMMKDAYEVWRNGGTFYLTETLDKHEGEFYTEDEIIVDIDNNIVNGNNDGKSYYKGSLRYRASTGGYYLQCYGYYENDPEQMISYEANVGDPKPTYYTTNENSIAKHFKFNLGGAWSSNEYNVGYAWFVALSPTNYDDLWYKTTCFSTQDDTKNGMNNAIPFLKGKYRTRHEN